MINSYTFLQVFSSALTKRFHVSLPKSGEEEEKKEGRKKIKPGNLFGIKGLSKPIPFFSLYIQYQLRENFYSSIISPVKTWVSQGSQFFGIDLDLTFNQQLIVTTCVDDNIMLQCIPQACKCAGNAGISGNFAQSWEVQEAFHFSQPSFSHCPLGMLYLILTIFFHFLSGSWEV